MKIEFYKDNFRYQFTNEDISIGDIVYPIGHGRSTDNGWFLHNLNFSEFTPNDPHIVGRIDDYIRTQKGYNNKGVYFKLIGKQEQVETTREGSRFRTWNWIDIPI